ncbi:MAG: aldo/keto reductase [Alphaproteobacteria bacterium]|nr:aldo/keto reductase [Alphaproteobacteria bacterium]MCW5738540.1 aldo/keto reductase [Alphaproteobacteria bacterium]
MSLSRASLLRAAAGGALSLALGGRASAQAAMAKRRIPSSGEMLPVIGVGTWLTFDHPPERRAPLGEVLRVLFDNGGSVIDSSPMYGQSEAAVGALLAAANAREKAFIATKVWTQGRQAGIEQMRRSMELLRTGPRIELMQVHNLVDWRTHLATLRAWKAEGRVRYLGVTHYQVSAHDELEAVMRAQPLDFVQLNYALNDRAAERRLLPLAAERGIAVIVNQPLGGGGLIRRMMQKPLPGWAAEIGCTSWAQILLKFVLGHPAVTCAIPGTSRPDHMRDNVRAGFGALPDAAMRTRMIEALDG